MPRYFDSYFPEYVRPAVGTDVQVQPSDPTAVVRPIPASMLSARRSRIADAQLTVRSYEAAQRRGMSGPSVDEIRDHYDSIVASLGLPADAEPRQVSELLHESEINCRAEFVGQARLRFTLVTGAQSPHHLSPRQLSSLHTAARQFVVGKALLDLELEFAKLGPMNVPSEEAVGATLAQAITSAREPHARRAPHLDADMISQLVLGHQQTVAERRCIGQTDPHGAVDGARLSTGGLDR